MPEEDLGVLRKKYLPPGGIRLLFVGESPPGGTNFFYLAQSTLFKHTARVFHDECGFPAEGEAFLRAFAGAGCYLEDMFLDRGTKVAKQPEHV